MEVQFLSESESHQNNLGISYNHKLIDDPLQEKQLQSCILSLVKKGFPIFMFDLRPQTKNQNQNLLQQTNKQAFLNEKILTYNRKSKSLEQLSKKFIDHFQGKGNNIIQLDKITSQLGVQRRRIYDIINILQSLNVVKKKGKNNYQWKGLYQAVRTINLCSSQPQIYKIQNIKKEKSLEYLASGFLRLFINWKPAISLEQAAREMMKETDESVIKTKIRRLYDIINVFRSLGLVRRATLASKKPGYEWAGTDFLECLILKKQENDQNTRLNELISFEEVQIIQQKSTPILLAKRSSFSPLVCPSLQKHQIFYLKQLFQEKEQATSFKKQSEKLGSNQQFSLHKNQFPIFHRSTSAFSLVNSDGKDFQ